MPVEDLGSAPDGEIVDDPRLWEREASHITPEAEQLGNGADGAAYVRRSPEQPFFEQPHHRLELRDIAIVSLRVSFDVPPNLLPRETATTGEQIIAIAGKKVVGLAEDDLQPVPLQLHVTDDLGLEQAHRVARSGIAEARQKFVSNRRASDATGGFDHRDVQALLREVIGTG